MSRKHIVWMMALCLIPLAAVLILFTTNITLSTPLLVALIALCPLSHLLMMALMPHHDHQPESPDTRKFP